MASERPRSAWRRAAVDPRSITGLVVIGLAVWLGWGKTTDQVKLTAVALGLTGLGQVTAAWLDARRAESDEGKAVRAALDERRRVALMAREVGAPGARYAEAAATIANFAAYHEPPLMTPRAAAELQVKILSGTADRPTTEAIERVVDGLCRLRGDEPMFGRPETG